MFVRFAEAMCLCVALALVYMQIPEVGAGTTSPSTVADPEKAWEAWTIRGTRRARDNAASPLKEYGISSIEGHVGRSDRAQKLQEKVTITVKDSIDEEDDGDDDEERLRQRERVLVDHEDYPRAGTHPPFEPPNKQKH